MKRIKFICIMAVFLILAGTNMIYASSYAELTLPIKVKWGDMGLIKGEKYETVLKAETKDAPMPDGQKGGEYHLKLSEKHKHRNIPKIIYEEAGDYQYTIYLKQNSHKGGIYKIHVQAVRDEDDQLYTVMSIRKEGKSGVKTDSINYMDLSDDAYYGDYYEDEKNSSASSDEDTKHKADRNNTKVSAKTGDEKQVDLYLVLCMLSMTLILIAGQRRKAKR